MFLTAANGLFKLDDQPFFPRFGIIPYAQIEPDRWPILLESFKKSGLNGVSAAVSLSRHVTEEQVYDFDGRSHPSRNLIGFIEVCRTASLPLVINPGPFDQRQLFSLGQSHQREQLVRWYESLGAALLQYQADPIIAVQIDCASACPDHHQDYHRDPEVAARFRHSLEHKYGTLEALNQVWGSSWQDWSEIRPLTPPLKQDALHDWQEFGAQWSRELLDWLTDLAHNLLPVPLYCGYDLTTKYSDTPYAADFPFRAALTSDVAAMRLASPACAARLDCAGLDENSNITANTATQAAISAIAHGTKAFGSWRFQIPRPSSAETTATDSNPCETDRNWSAIQATARFIAHYEQELLAATAILDNVGILCYEPNQQLYPEDFLLGRYAIDPSAFIRREGLYGVYALLAVSGFRPRFMDLKNAEESELRRCRILFFPNLGYIDRDSYDKLVQYVEAGGVLVTLPVHPKYDLSGKPLDTSALYATPEKNHKSVGRLGLLVAWAWHLARLRFFEPKSGSQPKGEYEPELIRNDYPASGDSLKMSADMSLNMYMRAELEPILKTHLPAMPMVDATGRYIRGDIQHTVFVPRADAHVLLLSPSSSEILGYAMPFGQGVSAVLGTVIGGSLMLPHYYRLSEAEIRTLCEFCRDLLAEWGLTPRTKSELPVEVVYRTTPAHTYVFLINRGRARAGRFELARDLCPGAPEVVFSWGGSEAEPVLLGQIQAKLGEDGIVVLRYRR